jgi:uncharacterized protein YjbI with pentapeptide repeats
VTAETVTRIIDAARTDAGGQRYIPSWTFEDATFVDPVSFAEVRFGSVNFRGATFKREARFDSARFDNPAEFACATFEGNASFKGAVFRCKPNFEHIERASSDARDRPGEVSFRKWADFRDTIFQSGANFGGTRFEGRARFGGAIFGVSSVTAGDKPLVSFAGARFEQARTFGPVLAFGRLSLDRATFEGPVRIAISARDVSGVTTQFMGRTTIELRWAAVDLEDAEFAQPSIVARASAPFELEAAPEDPDRPGDEPRRVLGDAGLAPEDSDPDAAEDRSTPRLESVSRANVGNLTLSELDLRRARFVGAHNLDGLRFEGAEFPPAPGALSTRRRVIREELTRGDEGAPDAERIARTYRALRKGREDNKDEPGAADFYYGEMEMRRRARPQEGDPPGAARTSGWEWAILNVYRGVSGYGLRSSRALFWLLVTVLLFAWGLQAWGFDPDQNFWKSLIFSGESTSSLFRAAELGKEGKEQIVLTDLGRVLQMGLRLLGPLFFGLALLALRGRVKR